MSQATFSLATLAPAMPEVVLLLLTSALLLIDVMHVSVADLLAHVAKSKL